MIKELRQLYTDEQNHRIAKALGNKTEPADLMPRFLIALNERNLEKMSNSHVSAVLSADSSAEIGNRERELEWQVNKLIELIGGE